MWLSIWGGGGVHWWQVVGSLWLVLCFRGVFPAFCPLSCCALGGLLAYVPLFGVFRGFLEGFGAVVWVCVGLVICVACGAFVCLSG